MKQLFISFCLIFIPFFSFSQKIIKLPKDSFNISNRKFYVSEVIDKRKNKKFIGELWKGAFKKTDKITVEGGIYNYLNNWFLSNFPKTSENQIEIHIYIKYITVNQTLSYSKETGNAFVGFEFIDMLGYKHDIHSEISEETEDALSTHSQRLIEVFRDCVRKFNKGIPDRNTAEINSEDAAVEIVFDKGKQTLNSKEFEDNPEKVRRMNNRNIFALGYQIGGYTLIGVDYEIRVNDYFGIHLGAGFIGFTGGMKIHTNKDKNSMFFNLSWKDTGLGMYNGFGIEAGDRWIWSKKRDFGLYYQGGIFILNHIDSDFEQILYKGSPAPPISLSLGIGLSW